MSWLQVLYASPLFLVAILSLFGLVWRRLFRTQSKEDTWYFAAGALWAFAAAMETSSINLRTATFWCQVQLLSIAPIPYILWLYILNHTGQQARLTRRKLLLLAIVPVSTLLLILTNDAHGLIVRHREMRSMGAYIWLDKTYGPLLIVFMTYLGMCILGACATLVRRMRKDRQKLFFWQPIAVMISFLIAGFAGLAQLTFFPYYNVACLAFVMCVVLTVQTILPLRRSDVLPVAWKLVVEGMDDVVLVLDAEQRLVDLNPKACVFIGSSRREALRKPLEDVWPGEKETLERLLLPGQAACEVVRTAGSEPRTFDPHVSALRDDQGTLVSLVLVLRDISERQEAELALCRYREHLEELVAERTAELRLSNQELKREIAQREIAQKELKYSEERFQTIFEHAPEAYFLSDLKSVFIDGNRAVVELVGYPKDELIGGSFLKLSLLPPSQLPKAAALLARNVLGQKTGPDEFLVNRGDGSQVAVEISTTPVQIAGQTVVLGMAHDLTERKRAEEALRRAHEGLELRVRERTAQLAETNQALQQEIGERRRAEEQVRTSLTEKEALLKEIHHRVKNNLQIISSLLSLQAANLHEPQILAIFAESEHRVRSMALIHEKLYRSHDLARINFRDYAEDLLTYLHRSYSDAWGRIQLRVEAEDVMLTVESAVPCGLILNELVNNCFKHAFPGGRAGTIVVGIHTNGDGRVHLSVADDGVGLPAGLNLAETTSLGMQLVHSLTEQLGGELSVANGQGASFAVAFAAAEAVEDAMGAASSAPTVVA